MPPIQASATRPSTQAHAPGWDVAPPARGGLAIPYFNHADLLAMGSVSKQDRARLETRLANKTSRNLITAIAGMGANASIQPSFFSNVASKIAALDQRVAAPLWQRLEHRFICLAANDIDFCAETEKATLLKNLINLSKHNLPADVHSRVLVELIGVSNHSFNDPDATCAALCILFKVCRKLPLEHRVAPLRNLLLSLPFGASDAFKPQIRELINAMKREVTFLKPEQQLMIEHEMHQANSVMQGFFASLERVIKLPPAERHASMSKLVERMLTVEHNSADATITNTLRFFSSQPHMMNAAMLANLVPKVSLISNQDNRAARLRMLVKLADAFVSDARAPLLKNIAAVAASLSESDRKRTLRSLYLSTNDMNARDKLVVVGHANALGATLPAAAFGEVVISLPTKIQQFVGAAMLA